MMTGTVDLVIRGGMLADGTGEKLYEADIAIADGRIVEIGHVTARGAEEIDAKGLLVTPGFIDLHTHLDGHVTWESRLQPVTGHGVTTAMIGNCGVGFAPCRPQDREFLIRLMETVEDIPFADLAKGLPWDWETYPDYLDALSRRSYNMDICTLIPHSTLRAYVMGERSLNGEPATPADIAQMAQLAREAIAAGAQGFGTSTLRDQRTSDGRHIPSLAANEAEFTAIANGMSAGGGGVLQVAIEFNQFPLACAELEMFARVGKASGRPIMFSLKQTNGTPEGWRDLLAISDRANREGVAMHPQVLGRPTGAIMGLQTRLHPFSRCPSYAPYVDLPLAQRVAAMRNPELRAQLINEVVIAQQTMPERLRGFGLVFPFSDPPNYEPLAEQSVDGLAKSRSIRPEDLAYDLLLENDGHGLLLLAGGNYAQFSLDPALAMIRNPHSVPGLGDAGAHSSIICDASISTYMLSYWTRDRSRGEKIALPQAVKWLTQDCAKVIGLHDRGVLKPGYRADINVIDYENLTLHAPRTIYDLPNGGPRLVQDVEGYVATILRGEIVHHNDRVTDKVPGRLVRGEQPRPQ